MRGKLDYSKEDFKEDFDYIYNVDSRKCSFTEKGLDFIESF